MNKKTTTATIGTILVITTIFAVLVPLGVATQGASRHSRFNQPGNLLITDQFNNRVIEVDPVTKAIVWSFGSGNGLLCNPGPRSIIGSNDAERLSGGLTPMVGTGIPAGQANTTPCVDSRVIVVNQHGEIVWQHGESNTTGSGPNRLNIPVFFIQTPNHNMMIVDQGNNRVIEVSQSDNQAEGNQGGNNQGGTIVWSYGPASGPGALNTPNSAELLANGHIHIADENNIRVIEITRDAR